MWQPGAVVSPSLPIILYGLVARAPVDLLFLAGVVPGFVLLLLLALYALRPTTAIASHSNAAPGARYGLPCGPRSGSLHCQYWC
jgi:TRAP-type C4-dicarboxylate transport system permease large subunit